MDKDRVYKELLDIINSVVYDESIEINEYSELTDELGISSFDIVYISGEVEDHFKIKIKLEEVYVLKTFGELVDYVYIKLNGENNE